MGQEIQRGTIDALKQSIMNAIDIRKVPGVLTSLQETREVLVKCERRIQRRSRRLNGPYLLTQLIKGVGILFAASQDRVSALHLDAPEKGRNDQMLEELNEVRSCILEYISLTEDYFRVYDEVKQRMDASDEFVIQMANLVYQRHLSQQLPKGELFMADCAALMGLDIGDPRARAKKCHIYMGSSFTMLMEAEIQKNRALYLAVRKQPSKTGARKPGKT